MEFCGTETLIIPVSVKIERNQTNSELKHYKKGGKKKRLTQVFLSFITYKN